MRKKRWKKVKPCEADAMYFPFTLKSRSHTSEVCPFKIAIWRGWVWTGPVTRRDFPNLDIFPFLLPACAFSSFSLSFSFGVCSIFVLLLIKLSSTANSKTTAATTDERVIVSNDCKDTASAILIRVLSLVLTCVSLTNARITQTTIPRSDRRIAENDRPSQKRNSVKQRQ